MSDKERDSIQEMEDIQKGLEAFLQQEMQGMQTPEGRTGRNAGYQATNAGPRTANSQAASRPTPQMYDMKDEEEEELDVIGSDRRVGSWEDYAEDWDDPAYRLSPDFFFFLPLPAPFLFPFLFLLSAFVSISSRFPDFLPERFLSL